MKRFALIASLVLAFGLFASSQQDIFRTRISIVDLPVSFLDRSGAFLSNVDVDDVTLTDNGAPQHIISFDAALRPISMVVLVDTSSQLEGVLPNLRNSGILFTQLVMGSAGEAAVLTYDQTVEVRQDFTTNADLVEKAFHTLKGDADETRMTDGVFRALSMLRNRSADRRRVIVILGDGLDLSGENHRNQALAQAQLENVSIYTVQLNRFKTITHKQDMPPVIGVVPPGQPHEPGVPLGSNTGVSTFGINTSTIGGKSVKGLVMRSMQTYSDGTGSDHINATSDRAVASAVEKIGRDLHSQYWISYKPNNLGTNPEVSEFHNIVVKVREAGVKVRHRPGYLYTPAP